MPEAKATGMDGRIGVIGLGRMGRAIAGRLLAGGAEVSGWNRSALETAPVEVAATLGDLAARSDILVLSLFDDAAVRDVMDALVALPLEGKLIVDTSTVSPEVLIGFRGAVEAAGADAVDAPISGGPEMVAEGTAGIFLGGTATAAARAHPILGAVSGNIVHAGPLGAGAAAKVVNNMMLCGIWQTLKEALTLGQAAWLDTDTMLEFLSKSPAASPAILSRMDILSGQADRVGFPVSGAVKDTSLFLKVAETLGVPTPVLEAGNASFRDAANGGFADHDLSMMVRAAVTARGAL
ncbi:MAG: NAD(P)-dependent oxidoreductase [Pseudomonadota bacterium]